MSRLLTRSASHILPRSIIALLLFSLAVSPVYAQNAEDIVRVEEDWELVISEPHPDRTAPQISCTMSPFSPIDDFYVTFDINHRNLPYFVPGGLQLELWVGAQAICSRQSPQTQVATTVNETIRWTQSMDVSGENLVFEIINGSSTTWGSFGGQGYLQFIFPLPVSNLNYYLPQTSVESSGVGYAGNRVGSLVLKRVRYTLASGEVRVDETPRVVE